MSNKPQNPASLNVRPDVEPIAMPGTYGVVESATFYPETVPGFRPGANGVFDDPEPEMPVKTTSYSVGEF